MCLHTACIVSEASYSRSSINNETTAVLVWLFTQRHGAIQKADIWSCGIILYAMLYGQHPFQARDATFAQKVVRGDYPIPADIPVSPTCLGLLKGILVPDPKARMGMVDIKQHPWFLQGMLHCCCCCKKSLCFMYIHVNTCTYMSHQHLPLFCQGWYLSISHAPVCTCIA